MLMNGGEKMSIIDDYGYREFLSFSMVTRQDILDRIEKERKKLEKRIQDEEDDIQKSRYMIIDRLFEDLWNEVDESLLFDLPSWNPKDDPQGVWRYEIVLDPTGMKLKMAFVDGYLDNQDEYGYIADEYNYVAWPTCFNVTDIYDEYVLIEIKSKLLTVEEYAKLYDVKVVTVRQWIRRGKIRTAIKIGGEWRIPELAGIPNKHRGYKEVHYTLQEPMRKLMDGFEFINEYKYITIVHRKMDNVYDITFRNGNKVKDILVDIAERERFELYLLDSGNVTCWDGNDIHYAYE